jgi:hypothetical protein
MARAIDFAIDVFPTPGGPANRRILPFPLLPSAGASPAVATGSLSDGCAFSAFSAFSAESRIWRTARN